MVGATETKFNNPLLLSAYAQYGPKVPGDECLSAIAWDNEKHFLGEAA